MVSVKYLFAAIAAIIVSTTAHAADGLRSMFPAGGGFGGGFGGFGGGGPVFAPSAAAQYVPAPAPQYAPAPPPQYMPAPAPQYYQPPLSSRG